MVGIHKRSSWNRKIDVDDKKKMFVGKAKLNEEKKIEKN
jgi:hypothetical protein